MSKIKLKNLAKIIFSSAFISLMLAVVPAYAFDGATLSEIKISSKDNYSYKVVLKTDKDVPVEKYITADNKIVIDLKNAKSAEFVNTIYNNTPEIDNVIVQAVANNKVRIFIQGLNIASSKIILDSRSETLDLLDQSTPALSTNTDNIPAPKTETVASTQNTQSTAAEPPVINLAQTPVSNSNLNTTVEEPIKTQPLENNSFNEENNIETVKNSMLGGISLKKVFSKEGFDWILRIFAAVFIIIGAVKLINKPKNVTIDLSSENLKTKEIELYRAANERKELLSRSIGGNLTRESQIKKSTYGANSQYGIHEYQNSQLPPQRLNRPVENSEMKLRPAASQINSELNKANRLNSALKTTKTAAEIRKPAINNSKINQKNIKTAKTNVDNVKFLESMAAIYQKSGRDDLAHNIRQNIMKTRAAG